MANALFIDLFSAFVDGAQQWTTRYTATTDTTVKAHGYGSRKLSANYNVTPALSGTSGRASWWVARDTLPVSGNSEIALVRDSGTQTVFGLCVNSGGHLVLTGVDNGNVLKTGTVALATSTFVRITVTWSITSVSSYAIKVYVGGVLDISATNADGGLTNSVPLYWYEYCPLGNGWYQDLWIDDGSDLADPAASGLRREISAKRLTASGATAVWRTTGTGSGYGTGHAAFLNDRPWSAADFLSPQTTAGSKDDQWVIEAASVGDDDLTGVTLVARVAWLIADLTGTGTVPVTSILDNGSAFAYSPTATKALFTHTTLSATYPVTAPVIGVRTSAGNGQLPHVYAAGVVFVYDKSNAVTRAVTGSGGATASGSGAPAHRRASTAAGGAITSGAAGVRAKRAISGTGGATASGAAVALNHTGHAVLASGGAVASGAATMTRRQAVHAIGGAAAGGTGGITSTRLPIVSGGALASGTAAARARRTVLAAGGATAGGVGVVRATRRLVGTGGGAATGAAAVSRLAILVASGGGTASGVGAMTMRAACLASGGATAGGSSLVSTQRVLLPAGGATGTGAAQIAQRRAVATAGGAIVGGEGIVTTRTVTTASGGAAASGSAAILTWRLVTATGGGSASGSATTTVTRAVVLAHYDVVASGGAVASGAARITVTRAVATMGGGASTNGAAAVAHRRGVRAIGGAQSSGSAMVAQLRTVFANGGAMAGGAAAAVWISRLAGRRMFAAVRWLTTALHRQATIDARDRTATIVGGTTDAEITARDRDVLDSSHR